MATDEIALKAKLQQLKLEEKQRKRAAKLERKLQKKEVKKAKKEASLKAKVETQKSMVSSSAKPPAKVPGDAEPPEAEILEAEGKPWSPTSLKTLEEKRARIDRLSAEGVKSLKMRFREKYGEELEVPDMYEKSFDYGEGSVEGPELPAGVSEAEAEINVGELKQKKGGLFGRKPKPAAVATGARPLRFFDLRRPLYLKGKFTDESSGGGKKAVMLIIDLFVLIILFPLTLIRILTTIIYVIKDGRAAKRTALLPPGSPQQPSNAST